MKWLQFEPISSPTTWKSSHYTRKGARHDSLDDETFRTKTVFLLYKAVEKNSFHLICCLLAIHVPMDSARESHHKHGISSFRSFLTHGWDINAPVDWDTSSPAA